MYTVYGHSPIDVQNLHLPYLKLITGRRLQPTNDLLIESPLTLTRNTCALDLCQMLVPAVTPHDFVNNVIQLTVGLLG